MCPADDYYADEAAEGAVLKTKLACGAAVVCACAAGVLAYPVSGDAAALREKAAALADRVGALHGKIAGPALAEPVTPEDIRAAAERIERSAREREERLAAIRAQLAEQEAILAHLGAQLDVPTGPEFVKPEPVRPGESGLLK